MKADLVGARAPIRFEASDHDAGGAVTNGTIELRGSTTRSAPQKSYQIKLSAGAAPWRGSRTINLLKHPFDLTRVRNTLSFELLPSHHKFHQLAHRLRPSVYRRGRPGPVRVGRGTRRKFSHRARIGPGGTLYKARNFPFAPIDNETAFDPAKVAAIIAAKARPDLAKLRRMLAAVNDTSQPIDAVARALLQP